MARPLKPTFSRDEVDGLICPMVNSPLRLVSRRWPEGKRVITSEQGDIMALVQIEPEVLAFSQVSEIPAYRLGNYGAIQPSQELQRLGGAWHTLDSVMRFHVGSREEVRRWLAPRLMAFYDAFSPLNEAGYSDDIRGLNRSPIPEPFQRELDYLLASSMNAFQHRVRAPEMQREVKRIRARTYHNRSQQQRYLDALLERYGSLFVVRLDLGYDVSDVALMRDIGLDRVKQDFERFAGERRFHPLWKDDLVGLIWKLEDSAERRFHYHLLLFYRGDRAEQHSEDKRLLTEEWISEVTKGSGATYLSWENPEDTPMLVAPEGIITSKESLAYHAVVRFLDYLNRLDQLIRLEVPKGTNVYGRGHMPGSGRPGRRPSAETLKK